MKKFKCHEHDLITSRKEMRKHIRDKHIARAEFSSESKKGKKRMFITQSSYWIAEDF